MDLQKKKFIVPLHYYRELLWQISCFYTHRPIGCPLSDSLCLSFIKYTYLKYENSFFFAGFQTRQTHEFYKNLPIDLSAWWWKIELVLRHVSQPWSCDGLITCQIRASEKYSLVKCVALTIQEFANWIHNCKKDVIPILYMQKWSFPPSIYKQNTKKMTYN